MTDTLRQLYPAIEPYASGLLDVGEGHWVYWERCGTPGGIPAVFLHGGPGGGCSPDHRRFFDPARYNALLFDQRGCGRAPRSPTCRTTPPGISSPTSNGCAKSTARRNGWCSAAPGAARSRSRTPKPHPDRVSRLVLRGIFTLRRPELLWFYQEGASWLFPDKWEHYLAAIPPKNITT